MKADIHPTWYPQAKVTCGTCGNQFSVGSTMPEIRVEVCYNCHPFFTGKMQFVDTAGRVEKFQKRQKAAAARQSASWRTKKERRAAKRKEKMEEELARPETLGQLRKTT